MRSPGFSFAFIIVAVAVDAGLALAFRLQHAGFFIEADGPGGDVEFPGQVADAVGFSGGRCGHASYIPLTLT